MGWWVFVGVVGWVWWDCYLLTYSSPSLLSTSILPLVFRVVVCDRVVGVVFGVTWLVFTVVWVWVWCGFGKCGCVGVYR